MATKTILMSSSKLNAAALLDHFYVEIISSRYILNFIRWF